MSEPIAWRYRAKLNDAEEYTSNPAYLERYKNDIYDVTPLYPDAPPSAPTGDGAAVPEITEEDVDLVRENLEVMVEMSKRGHVAKAQVDAYARLLALLDWATRRQEQGNG